MNLNFKNDSAKSFIANIRYVRLVQKSYPTDPVLVLYGDGCCITTSHQEISWLGLDQPPAALHVGLVQFQSRILSVSVRDGAEGLPTGTNIIEGHWPFTFATLSCFGYTHIQIYSLGIKIQGKCRDVVHGLEVNHFTDIPDSWLTVLQLLTLYPLILDCFILTPSPPCVTSRCVTVWHLSDQTGSYMRILGVFIWFETTPCLLQVTHIWGIIT